MEGGVCVVAAELWGQGQKAQRSIRTGELWAAEVERLDLITRPWGQPQNRIFLRSYHKAIFMPLFNEFLFYV